MNEKEIIWRWATCIACLCVITFIDQYQGGGDTVPVICCLLSAAVTFMSIELLKRKRKD